MYTVGRNLGRRKPNGDYNFECSYCGITWPRSKMIRDEAGLLACPDDKAGRTSVQLDRLNAANASSINSGRPRRNPRW